MSLLVDCAGAPRDLGLDQGRACRAELAERFAALSWTEAVRLRAGRCGAPVARLRRDVARHFPHLSESLAGLAVGAEVPEAFAAREVLAELGDAGERPAAALAGETARLALALDGACVVRRSRPEGLFASVDATRPWLPSTLIGVNERGLAVAVVASEAGGGGGCAAPAALLAQDCLERFESLDGALEWCVGRPGGGRATLFLADRAGEVAGVECASDGRRVLRPAEGRLVGDAGGADLAKALGGASSGLAADVVVVDTGARELRIGGARFSL